MLRCLINGLISLIKCGEWIPHVYHSTFKPAIIIATRDGFRVAKDYKHAPDETVYPTACLITNRCKYCGKVMYSWHRYYNQWLRMSKEDV